MKFIVAIPVLGLLLGVETLRAEVPSLPDFMSASQLVDWSAGKAQKALSTTEPKSFYTGKPYVAEAGGYLFKYRTYNADMCRWTSQDPTGFPDGANQVKYCSNPIDEVDALGASPNVVTFTNTETVDVSYDIQYNTKDPNNQFYSILPGVTTGPGKSIPSAPGYGISATSNAVPGVIGVAGTTTSDTFTSGVAAGGETPPPYHTYFYFPAPNSPKLISEIDFVTSFARIAPDEIIITVRSIVVYQDTFNLDE